MTIFCNLNMLEFDSIFRIPLVVLSVSITCHMFTTDSV